MLSYVLRRILQFIPTVIGIMLLVFFLFNWVGGDPAYLLAGKISNPEQIENIRRQLGVDQPYYMQWGIFVRQVFTGDMGVSWATGEKVSYLVWSRLGPSLTILVPMLVLSTGIALGLGLLVAYFRGLATDRWIMVACTVGQSISILVYIIVLQYVFSYELAWFPVQGWAQEGGLLLIPFCVLPVMVGVVVSLAPDTRLYRAFFMDEIQRDYVRTARAKGLTEWRVMGVHVMRNVFIPVLTHVMIQLPGLLAGSFLIERFFSIPGIGREVLLAVERSDFPVIKAVTLYVAVATILVNLLTDILYRWIDPRVQLK